MDAANAEIEAMRRHDFLALHAEVVRLRAEVIRLTAELAKLKRASV